MTGAGPTQYVQLAQEKEEQKKAKTSPKPQREEPPPSPSPSPLKQPPPQGDTVESRPGKNKTLVAQMPQLEPAILPTPVVVTQGLGEGTRLDEKETQRLCSETNRLLLCHQEHAMTVSELVACFRAADDPAQPSPEELYLCLKKQNNGKKKKTFQVELWVLHVCMCVHCTSTCTCTNLWPRELWFLICSCTLYVPSGG